jgi:Cft2 family RNA processing exonuclease
MVESTYGNRLHGDVSSADQMAAIINEAAKRNAPILIPRSPSDARRRSCT